MQSKLPQTILDNRHLKVLAAKRDILKDSVVFLNLNEDSFGELDVQELEAIAQRIDDIEPDGSYFVGSKDIKIDIYERSEIRNKNLRIVFRQKKGKDIADQTSIEQYFREVFKEAKSVDFVYLPECEIQVQ